MTIDPRLHRIVAAQPYPLLFGTISGAHLYGFPSPASDYVWRGAHVLPLDAVVGLEVRDETVQDSRVIDGLEMDIVSHDVKKFFGLLLKICVDEILLLAGNNGDWDPPKPFLARYSLREG